MGGLWRCVGPGGLGLVRDPVGPRAVGPVETPCGAVQGRGCGGCAVGLYGAGRGGCIGQEGCIEQGNGDPTGGLYGGCGGYRGPLSHPSTLQASVQA